MLTSTSPRGAERDTDTRSWRAVGAAVMGGVEDIGRILLVESHRTHRPVEAVT